jgi:prepilin signal peptidase PulO-like enzyme (type II secretory pathway)
MNMPGWMDLNILLLALVVVSFAAALWFVLRIMSKDRAKPKTPFQPPPPDEKKNP